MASVTRRASARRRSDQLVGTSRAVKDVLKQIAVAGRGSFPVWIHGEDGVPVETVARLIHAQSDWATGEFHHVAASVMPPSLLARELFGADAGAIESLSEAYRGAFERARNGTVLIERFDTVPKDLQQELASALESKTRQYRRIGGTEPVTLESRLIAAGEAPLEQLVVEDRVVQELAKELRLLEIHIPPLRERREDIIPTALHQLTRARETLEHETGKPVVPLSFERETLERLRAHSWPANERELSEQIVAAVRLARGAELAPEDLLLSWDASEDIPSFRDAKRQFEHDYVTRVLRLCHGNISRAARIAKKDRKDFYDVMRRNNIDPKDFRN